MNSHPNRNRLLSILFSAVIFGLIVAVGTRYYSQVGELITRVEIRWFAAGIACYCCNYLCRAYRVWLYGKKKGRFFPVYVKISGLHGFNTYFLPLRGGDMTLPFLLRFHVGIPLLQGGRILIRARMLDIFLLGFLLISATLLTPSEISFRWQGMFIVAGMCLIALPYIATFLVQNSPGWMGKWFQKIIGEELPSNPNVQESLLSLLIWFWTGCTIFCVIRSLDMPLSFLDVWLLATIQLPLQLLPVQGLANAGNHEAGWVIALAMLGVEPEQGLAFALSSHLLIISYVVLLGAVAVLLPSGQAPEEASGSVSHSG